MIKIVPGYRERWRSSGWKPRATQTKSACADCFAADEGQLRLGNGEFIRFSQIQIDPRLNTQHIPDNLHPGHHVLQLLLCGPARGLA